MACAVDLARKTGAALTLVDAIDTAPGGPAPLAASVEQDVIDFHRARLTDLALRARAQGIEVTEAVLHGSPSVEVIRMVLREGHDTVIKGASVAEDGQGVLTGIDMHLLRSCPCPVWMLMRATDAAPSTILAAVAAADPADTVRAGLDRKVLDLAAGLGDDGDDGDGDGGRLRVIHAWSLPGEHALRHGRFTTDGKGDVDALVAQERQAAEARLKSLVADHPQVARDAIVLAQGAPGTVIAAHAEAAGVDTIVMGTVGRTGVPGFVIGTTAETILGRVACSVIALKPEGFVSPVTLDRIG